MMVVNSMYIRKVRMVWQCSRALWTRSHYWYTFCWWSLNPTHKFIMTPRSGAWNTRSFIVLADRCFAEKGGTQRSQILYSDHLFCLVIGQQVDWSMNWISFHSHVRQVAIESGHTHLCPPNILHLKINTNYVLIHIYFLR